jgi:hypothetical protein
LATDGLIEDRAFETEMTRFKRSGFVGQNAAQDHVYFFKVHFPALGKGGNHCELKRPI